jgi:predicted acylesterase/phospholipase RssA
MTVAFALSGGGSRGDFEIGALTFLYETGLRPNVICGTSVGAINAIKLAEGEDASNPDRGFSGLKAIWDSLQGNDDMFKAEAWLFDPKMDPRISNLLTGRTSELGIAAPRSGGPWGILQVIIDGANQLGFLATDGIKVLNSIGVVLDQARGLYNLSPVVDKLKSHLDVSAIQAWADSGGKLRLASVALESGRLRFVTERGNVIERDGTPVMDFGKPSPECSAFASALDSIVSETMELESERNGLQLELQGADPGEKSRLVAQIKSLNKLISDKNALRDAAEGSLQECLLAHPSPLTLPDLSDGALASASLPGIFIPVKLGSEYYVDGGLREVNPIQVAADLGADTIYAIWASSSVLAPFRTPPTAGALDIVARSLEEIAIDEIALNDRRVLPLPAQVAPKVITIEPLMDFHDIITIDPGLVKIMQDYGYMRAADAVDAVNGTRRAALATDITGLRTEIWRLENALAGQPDPTRLGEPVPATDQVSIDGQKQTLLALINERRSSPVGGPVPKDIDFWVTHMELHPWTSSQDGWRWCNKCAGLFFGNSFAVSHCPAGGTHADPVQSGSGNYSLPNNVPERPNSQSNWRWCNKCQGLFHGPEVASSSCPAGGQHADPAQSGSGNYSLPHSVPESPDRQSDWRWCNKCTGLFHGPEFASSSCPAGGHHADPAQSGSGNYSLPHRPAP